MSRETSSKTAQQFKCNVCGQVFNSQGELDDHYKFVHTGRTPTQSQSTRGMSSSSSSSAARWSGQAVEHQSDTDTGNEKDSSVTEGEGSSRTWKEATKEELKSMGEDSGETANNSNATNRTMPAAYSETTGKGGETAVHGEDQNRQSTQNQFKCQHCGQVFASQNDLNRHNKNIHGMETEGDMGKRRQPQESVAT